MDTTPRLPSVPQMVNRSLHGHHKALRCLADGNRFHGPGAGMGAQRGLRTIVATLRRWECMTEGEQITDRGRELLAALDMRAQRAQRTG